MSKKLRTIYLESNGFGRAVVTTEAVLRGIFGCKTDDRPPRWIERYSFFVDFYGHLANSANGAIRARRSSAGPNSGRALCGARIGAKTIVCATVGAVRRIG
jgi:hypothetical protein